MATTTATTDRQPWLTGKVADVRDRSALDVSDQARYITGTTLPVDAGFTTQ